MSTASRPDSPTYFSTHPGVDPNVGAALDTVLNYIISVLNSLDNDNIDGNPAIDASKLALGASGFLQLTGGNMTGILGHIFEGVWRRERNTGNARIREYNATAVDALWGICYNTEYNSGWQGRDVTDVCWRIEVQSDGLHFFWAVSAATGVAPTWVEKFHGGLSGIEELSFKADTIGEAEIKWADAGGLQQGLLHEKEITRINASWGYGAVDESAFVQVYIPANANSLEYKVRAKGSATTGGANDIHFKLTLGAAEAQVTVDVTADNTYAWSPVGTLDVSGVSGWQSLSAYIKNVADITSDLTFDRIVYRIK